MEDKMRNSNLSRDSNGENRMWKRQYAKRYVIKFPQIVRKLMPYIEKVHLVLDSTKKSKPSLKYLVVNYRLL